MLGLPVQLDPKFDLAYDVPNAGVLLVLPMLLANGLLFKTEENFEAPKGIYPLAQLLLFLAFLILTRILSIEKVRYEPCGEWGRILGLDRIPEVKTLRQKIAAIAEPKAVTCWAESLGKFWMDDDPDMAGILYVDGHVRAYHGDQTRLPERFSSRDRLCVRSLMDYWVNDRDGKPFFVVTAIGTEGMLHHLRTDIIPRLLRDIPNQPSDAELAANPDRHRFIIVFDREGWSPTFFAELWNNHRIAVLSYRKGKYEPWAEEKFTRHTVKLPHGNHVEMNLAEIKSCDTIACETPLREIRRLSEKCNHQTAIITTCRTIDMVAIAGHLFARWSQENYLNYATRELAIDQLGAYDLCPAPDTAEVKNPTWRTIDQQARRLRAQRKDLIVKRGKLVLIGDKPTDIEAFNTKSAEISSQIDEIQTQIDTANATLKTTPKRILIKDLPESDRPKMIGQTHHHFINILKIIAYRSETALIGILRKHFTDSDSARALAKDIFTQTANLIPDHTTNTLTIQLHHFTNPQSTKAVAELIKEINASEIVYPGSQTRIRYAMVSSLNPGDQGI